MQGGNAVLSEAQYKKQHNPYSRLVLRSLGEGGREKTSSVFICSADYAVTSKWSVSETSSQEKWSDSGMKRLHKCKLILQGKKGYKLSQLYSTYIDRTVAEGYAKNTKGESIPFEINVPAGARCLDVSKISTAPKKEDEILLSNTGKFVYNDVCYDNNSNRLIVRCEYVPD